MSLHDVVKMTFELPWIVDDILPPACDQLLWAAQAPDAFKDLLSGEVLIWQRVRDRDPRPLEFVVVWLHFRLANQGRCWALVELFRWFGDTHWCGEDGDQEDFRDWIRDLAQTGMVQPIQNELSRRCQCYTTLPDNDLVLAFLDLCSFFTPWVDGVQEVWDCVEDRVVNWSGWLEKIGCEPSPDIVRRFGQYRAV